MSKKKKVAIIFGGQSTEHEVSLKSATSVINNIDREKFDVVLIGITKEGGTHPNAVGAANLANYVWEQVGAWLNE